MLEMRQSNNILRQCIEKLPTGPVMADAPEEVAEMTAIAARLGGALVARETAFAACLRASSDGR